jgi:hypothetical protein
VQALADQAVRSRLADLGVEIFPRERPTPEALGALQKADAEKCGRSSKNLGSGLNEVAGAIVAPLGPHAPMGFAEPHGSLVRQPSKGSRARGTAGTTDQSANPMPFPRIPQGDIISVMSRRLGYAK